MTNPQPETAAGGGGEVREAAAWDAYWRGEYEVPRDFVTGQCRRETPDVHRRHLVFVEGYRAALRARSEGEGLRQLDVDRLAEALTAVLGDGEVSTMDGSMGVERTAPLIAAEYARSTTPVPAASDD